MSQQPRVVFSGVQPTSDSCIWATPWARPAVGRVAGRLQDLFLRRRPARHHRPRIPRCCAGAPGYRRAVPGARHRSRPFDDLRPEPRARHAELALGAGLFHRFWAGLADDAVQGQVPKQGADSDDGGLFTYPVRCRLPTCCSTTPIWFRWRRTSASTRTGPAMLQRVKRPFPGDVRGAGGDDRQGDRQDHTTSPSRRPR